MKCYIVATNYHRAVDLLSRIKSKRVSSTLCYTSISQADKRKSFLETKYPKNKFRIYQFMSSKGQNEQTI